MSAVALARALAGPLALAAVGTLGLVLAQDAVPPQPPRSADGPDPGPWATTYGAWQLDAERAARAAAEARADDLQRRVEELEAELAFAQDAAFAAEEEFQTFLQVLSGVAPDDVARAMAELGAVPEDAVAEAEPPPPLEEEPGLVRAAELGALLRSLLRSEEISGLDLLEPGRWDGERLGPVVFRTLDDRGRLTGSISAARLHLEAAVAGRTVTLVLSDGHEVAGGRRTPFTELRLPFVRVDPRPWIDAVPELFEDASVLVPEDDGTWDVEALRLRLGELLGRDAAGGFYRLRHLGGVRAETLLDLHLVEHDAEGRVLRHLFADTATLDLLDRGAVIALAGCVAVRGEEKRPFPGGVLRLYLPRAEHAAWRAARLPGIPAAGD